MAYKNENESRPRVKKISDLNSLRFFDWTKSFVVRLA